MRVTITRYNSKIGISGLANIFLNSEVFDEGVKILLTDMQQEDFMLEPYIKLTISKKRIKTFNTWYCEKNKQ